MSEAEKTGGAENSVQENTKTKDDKIWDDPDYNSMKPGQNILLTFLISFVSGILTASITLLIYMQYLRPPPVKYYSFDLSKIIREVKSDVMEKKNVSNDEIRGEIDKYISAMGRYVNFYAKRGIVFVGGATLGKSPYVTDITRGFISYYADAKK